LQQENFQKNPGSGESGKFPGKFLKWFADRFADGNSPKKPGLENPERFTRNFFEKFCGFFYRRKNSKNSGTASPLL